MSEYEIQKRLASYLKAKGYLFCASAGGMRTGIRTAVKMKATGYSKGFPDIGIYESRNGYHGLFIELKTKKGYASKEQKEWIDRLNQHGYKAYVCKGYDAAIDVIKEYMNSEVLFKCEVKE